MARVLVVEDDLATRQSATAMLQAQHHVYSARNGREAFAVLRATPHRLIVLLGGTMPTMTGWEAIEAITREGALARRHIYIVSSADRRLLAWARDQHAIAQRMVLRKPFDAEQLLGAVDVAARQLELSA